MDDSELASRVHEHRIFFDNLVELVPAKFYLPQEDRNNSWHHGMSKAERAAAKKSVKEKLKKARRDRLDPDKFTSTLKLLQQQETEKPVDFAEMDEAKHTANSRLRGKESRASTYEELRERLKKRMEMLRAKRNADAAAAAAKNAKNWQNQKKLDSQKRKRKSLLSGSNMETDVAIPAVKHRKYDPENMEDPHRKNERLESVSTFEFGRVKMGLDNNIMSGRKKKRKDSKEQLLTKATKLQLEMQGDKKGQELASKHSWNAALTRASGEKVFDDPSLLKRSIKKQKHQQQRSSKKWLERKETERKAADDKQQKRTEHIKEHKQQKKDRKIAKREKKLLRPGFEGRREGFINN